VFVFFLCLCGFSPPVHSYPSVPDELMLFCGQCRRIDLAFPASGEVTVQNPDIVRVNGKAFTTQRVRLNHPLALEPEQTGQTRMQLKLFGKIPIKTVTVNVVPDLKVIPGGQTIGVKLHSDGILVVGHPLVQVSPDKKISPGEQADLRLGDLIVKINGKPVRDASKVAGIVAEAGEAGKPLDLTVRRGDKTIRTQVAPAFDVNDRAWRLGIYIRDSAAGVGTLTFYAPEERRFGALGHVISDMDTRTPIVPRGGEVVHSSVSSISKSQHGEPGEKRAHFFKEHVVLGTIEKNT